MLLYTTTLLLSYYFYDFSSLLYFADDVSGILSNDKLNQINDDNSNIVNKIIINILAYDNYISIEEALDIAMKVYKKRFNIADRKTNKYFIELMEKTKKLAKQNFDDVDSIYELGEGWVAEEALAIALYSCIKYQNDFEKAIICAVNHGGDSDSTGAIAGNIIGTYLGFDQIPEYYIENLELRDVILELSEDLYTVCSTDEFDKSNDKYWLSKYLYIERDEKLKEKNNLKEDLSEMHPLE